jgi:hypothetical protein
MAQSVGRRLAAFLCRRRHVHSTSAPTDLERLKRVLRPADVLLVEGNSIIATAIKYLTQSTWSHAALYVGDLGREAAVPGATHMLIEADLLAGVRTVSLDTFAGHNCRICRPVGLSPSEIEQVVGYAMGRLGHTYDTRNIIDLARYLLPTPPVPTAWRRRMIALGSGDPTRAICSGLIAQAFESVRYPVLPEITQERSKSDDCPDCIEEILHVRHHSLYVPRDFDVSPYFEIIKPTIPADFDHRVLTWSTDNTARSSTRRLGHLS